MKISKKYIIYFAAIIPLCFIFGFCLSIGKLNIDYSGFGVDSSGVLYVGTEKRIEKYLDGKHIGSIDPHARAYAFKIQDNDTILLSDASYVYTLDLNGNELDIKEDPGTMIFNKLQSERKTFTDEDGQTYVIKSALGRTVIVCNDKTVYKMPFFYYVPKLVLIFVFITCFPVGLSFILKLRAADGQHIEWY